MKVIDQSPLRAEDGSISLLDRARGILQFGPSWDTDRQAEERLIAHLHRALDNKYTLIRSARIPDLPIQIPLVLVGPTGIYVIYASGKRGVYRAKDDIWAVMDANDRRFKPARPNLIKRTLAMTKAVEKYLQEEPVSAEEISPVLFLGHPGIHVDADQPALRLVRVDAVDRFVASIPQNPTVLDLPAIKHIADALTRPLPEPENQGVSLLEDKTVMTIGSLQLQRRHWLVIGVMAFMEICFLMIFFAVVFSQP